MKMEQNSKYAMGILGLHKKHWTILWDVEKAFDMIRQESQLAIKN